jgi:Skp family chaperone for outer membrane proteins
MNVTVITEIGMFLAALIGLTFTYVTNRKKRNSDRDMADIVSWKELNHALKAEVARLSAELKEARHEIKALEAQLVTLTKAIRGSGSL